jgi:hypothetical protein
MEMLMVVVLIGVLTGISASRLDWGRFKADAASRGIMAELAGAHRLAVSLQADVRVTQPSSTRLAIHEDSDNDGAQDSGERVRIVAVEEGYQLERGGAGDVPAPADPARLTAVVFRRDGSASRSGTFYLSALAGDQDCHRCRAVSLTRATGRLVWYSMSQGAWRRGN